MLVSALNVHSARKSAVYIRLVCPNTQTMLIPMIQKCKPGLNVLLELINKAFVNASINCLLCAY